MSCLDEELLQSYCDGELSASERSALQAHLTQCVSCNQELRNIEAETALLQSAFAFAEPASVPTMRLQERLRLAINADANVRTAVKQQQSAFRSPKTIFSRFFLTPVRLGWGLAAVSIVGLLLSVFLMMLAGKRSEVKNSDVAAVPFEAVAPVPPSRQLAATTNDNFKFRKSVDPKNVERMTQVSNRRTKSTAPHHTEPAVKLLPGEKSYLKAIISLEYTFKAQGDVSLRPELRVEYERNLAVVDQAIAMTRFTAIRNPLDPDANSMLLSAYQSKVDLISSVVTEGSPAPLSDR